MSQAFIWVPLCHSADHRGKWGISNYEEYKSSFPESNSHFSLAKESCAFCQYPETGVLFASI